MREHEITKADVVMNNVLVRGRRDVYNQSIYLVCRICFSTYSWAPLLTNLLSTHLLPWLGRNIKAMVAPKATPKASPKRASQKSPKVKAAAKSKSVKRTRAKKNGKTKDAKEEADDS